VVTICTTSLTFNNSTFFPHSVFMCFVWIWEQTAIISLYNINWLVCITETGCVYCAVWTGALNVQIRIWMVLKPVPCLKRLFAGLSQRPPEFYPRSFRMRSVVDSVALGQVFLRVFPFSLHHFPLLHLQFAVSKIGDHWVEKYFTPFQIHLMKQAIFWRPASATGALCYWYSCAVIWKGFETETGDWRLDLFNVLYLCCQLEHIQIQQGADKCNCGVLRWDALEGVIYILQTYSIILILLNLFDMLAEE